MAPLSAEERVWQRLVHDTAFWAQALEVKIVTKRSELVPIAPRPAQLKVEAAIQAQRDAGLPERVIVLKSRQTGISTWTQLKLIQRATLRPNRRALVVAHDNDTAGSLFDIGHNAYVNLPEDEPRLKPGLISMRNSLTNKFMHFGEPSRAARARGDMGLNCMLRIDTAKEAQAGRGKTITDLHCSEVAFWPDPSKALSLLNAVPDEPGTLVVLESTANGSNFFKNRWDRAAKGEGTFAPVFIGWLEDPDCQSRFRTEEERAAFIETIGEGEFGADEARLVERFAATPEQLKWRRDAIVDKCEGSVTLFKQEYPSSAGEAFVGSGRHVFPFAYIQRALDSAEDHDPPAPADAQGRPLGDGLFIPGGMKTREVPDGTVDVPTSAIWVPRVATGFDDKTDFFRVWEHPAERLVELNGGGELREPGQYIVAVDVAGGEEATSTGDTAWHAIEVVNHHTLEQCAEWRSRCDPDQLTLYAMLLGLYYNEAWVAVETTGHWGVPVVTSLWRRFNYRRVYRRRPVGQVNEKQQDLLGWDTNRRTKPQLEAGARELLREGTHGIKSKRLAGELSTYVSDEHGRSEPDTDAFSDLLMAWMIAQEIARTVRPRPPKKPGGAKPRWQPRNPTTGW